MRDHGGVAHESGTAEAPPRKSGKAKSVRDMMLSMAVLLGASFAIYLVFVPNDAGQDPVRPVPYEVEANTAARAAPYELLAPEGLPAAWRATAVRYVQGTDHGALWKLGFNDPDGEYAAVVQADGASRAFLTDATNGAEDTGETTRVDGRDWARYDGPKYRALVTTGPGVTTVVTGTASYERLAELAAALQPRA